MISSLRRIGAEAFQGEMSWKVGSFSALSLALSGYSLRTDMRSNANYFVMRIVVGISIALVMYFFRAALRGHHA